MHRLTALSLTWPRTIVAVVLGLTALAAMLASKVEMASHGAHAQLGADHPVVRTAEDFLDRYGAGSPLTIAWPCGAEWPCRSALDPVSLEMAYSVTTFLEHSSHVVRASSPATSPLLVPIPGEGFESRTLVRDKTVVPDLDRLAPIARADPLWQNMLISEDGRVGAIVVEVASGTSEDQYGVIQDARNALRPFEDAGFEFNLVGQAAVDVITHDEARRDGERVAVFTGITIAIIILLLAQSWQGLIAILVPVGCATVWMMAVWFVFGWERDAYSAMAPSVALVIGAATTIHVFARFEHERAQGKSDPQALRDASQAVASPCLMTMLTTAAAFLSFLPSRVETLSRFGVSCAVGIVFAWLLSFILLPALLSALPSQASRVSRTSARWNSALDTIANLGSRHAGIIAIGCLTLSSFCAIGIFQLRAEVDLLGMWSPDQELPRWSRFVTSHLKRPDTLELDLIPPEGVTVMDASSIETLHRVHELATQPEPFGRARSILDPLARANRLVHDDDPAHEFAPTDPQAFGELLGLLSFGGSGVVDPWISLDFERLRVSIEADQMLQSERAAALAQISGSLRHALPHGWDFSMTGAVAVAHDLTAEIEQTQRRSFAIAAITIFLLLAIYLRSLGWGALSMLPNLLPIAVMFGVMGYFGVFLDSVTAMVAPLAIGVIVDDTIHLVGRFRQHRSAGIEPTAAMGDALREAGRAVITTSLALSIGFLTLFASAFQNVHQVGLLCALAITVALLADLFFFPALVTLTARISERRQAESITEVSSRANSASE